MLRNDSSDVELAGVDPELAALALSIKARYHDGGEEGSAKKGPQKSNPFAVLSTTDRKILSSKLARDISKYSAAEEVDRCEGDVDAKLRPTGGWGSKVPAFTKSDLGGDWQKRGHRKSAKGGDGGEEEISEEENEEYDTEGFEPRNAGEGADTTFLTEQQVARRRKAEMFIGSGGSKSRAKAERLQHQHHQHQTSPLDVASESRWQISVANINDLGLQGGISSGGGTSSTSKSKKANTKEIPKELNHKFTHLLVIDFEATCDVAEPDYPHEIIEFPCVAVETETGCIVSEFQTFVRPIRNPKLTEFCKELTGIRQEDVDAAPLLPEAITMFRAWLDSLERDWNAVGSVANLYEKKAPVAPSVSSSTSGIAADQTESNNTDGGAATNDPEPTLSISTPTSSLGVYLRPPLRPGQVKTGDAAALAPGIVDAFLLAASEQTVIHEQKNTADKGRNINNSVTPSPKTLQSATGRRKFSPVVATDGPWDMRKFMHECSVVRDGCVFPELFYSWVDVRRNFSDFHKKRLMKLTHMLRFLGLSFIGERHRGIDDARNIARIAMSLVRKGYKFRQTCQVAFHAEGSVDLAQQRIVSDLLQDELKGGGSGMGSKKASSGSGACNGGGKADKKKSTGAASGGSVKKGKAAGKKKS